MASDWKRKAHVNSDERQLNLFPATIPSGREVRRSMFQTAPKGPDLSKFAVPIQPVLPDPPKRNLKISVMVSKAGCSAKWTDDERVLAQLYREHLSEHASEGHLGILLEKRTNGSWAFTWYKSCVGFWPNPRDTRFAALWQLLDFLEKPLSPTRYQAWLDRQSQAQSRPQQIAL